MDSYKELMRKRSVREQEFSTETQPKVAMEVVTKIERVQPCAVGTDKRGELVWQGRDMPRWQQLMFRVWYYGDFMAHWSKTHMFAKTGIESECNSMTLKSMKGYGKKKARVHQGD